MPLLENLVEGFSNAAGATDVAQSIEKKKADRRATAHEELQGQTEATLQEVRTLHDQKAKLDPKTDTEKIAGIDKRLGELQQHFTDLYHPEKNPGALQHLGGFIRAHLGGQKQPQVPTTPAQAKQQFSFAGSVAGTAAPTQQDPFTQANELFKRSTGRDMSPDEREQWAYKQSGIPLDKSSQNKPKRALRQGTVNGQTVAIYQDPNDPADAIYPNGESVPPEILSQFKPLPPRGFIGSESTTTDPFGVSSHTTRNPILPGANGSGASAPVKTPGEAKQRAAAVGPKQLDADGHIPASAKVNPQLREAANQIIDGMDETKLPIPQRDRAAAAELARSYGWKGQGLFGPKDQLLIRESTGILKQLAASPALSVLDDTASRLKLAQVLQNPDKRGVIGQTVQGFTAQNLSPAEQQFVTLYNQAVGRISGLSQLVRSGRATEAQIERLKTELPNPATTSNSAHARQKLAQIQNEIDIALQKGQFVEGQSAPDGPVSDDDFLKKF